MTEEVGSGQVLVTAGWVLLGLAFSSQRCIKLRLLILCHAVSFFLRIRCLALAHLAEKCHVADFTIQSRLVNSSSYESYWTPVTTCILSDLTP